MASNVEVGRLLKVLTSVLLIAALISFLDFAVSLSKGNNTYAVGAFIHFLWLVVFAYFSSKGNQVVMVLLSYISLIGLSDFSRFLENPSAATILVYPLLIIQLALVILPLAILVKTNQKRIVELEKKPSPLKSVIKFCALWGIISVTSYLITFPIKSSENNAFSSNSYFTDLFYLSPIIILLIIYAAKKNSIIGLILANGAIFAIAGLGGGMSMDLIRDRPDQNLWMMYDVVSIFFFGMPSLLSSVIGFVSLIVKPKQLNIKT